MKWLKVAEKNSIVNLDDLSLSWDQSRGLYTFLSPWSDEEYIDRIDKHSLGAGNRYILLRVLKQLKEEFPNNEVPSYLISTQPITPDPNPVVRRLGTKHLTKKYLKPRFVHKKSLDTTTEDKIDDQQKRNYGRNTDPNLWEDTEGTENTYKAVNRKEENFEVSKA